MKRLLIVVGCPRSGTTWLQQLLLSHPQVVGPSEETFLFARLAPAWALAHSAEGDIWGDRATSIAAIRRFCDRILTHVPGADEAALLVEKTPAHVFCLEQVAALYPDLAVIHLVRDGRDVARSLVEFEFGVPDLGSAATVWQQSLDAFDHARPRLHHAREVRYEDLLDDPVGVTSELLMWAGAPARA